MTSDQFFELSPRRVTLTVRPSGDGKPRSVVLTAPAIAQSVPSPKKSALSPRKVAQPAN